MPFVSLDTLIDIYGTKYVKPYGKVIQITHKEFEQYRNRIDPTTKVVILDRSRLGYVWIILPESLHIVDDSKGHYPISEPRLKYVSAHKPKFQIVSPKPKIVQRFPPVAVSMSKSRHTYFPSNSKRVMKGLDLNPKFRQLIIDFLVARKYMEVKSTNEYVIEIERNGTVAKVTTTDSNLVMEYLGMSTKPIVETPVELPKQLPKRRNNAEYIETEDSYQIKYGSHSSTVGKAKVKTVSDFLKNAVAPLTLEAIRQQTGMTITTSKRALMVLTNRLKTVVISRKNRVAYYQYKS